ncbi:hypothetical protein MHBO_003275 [Bonamia ostreae]|uniref:Uncharacterized protein n=1 Tax=Bonamia ostreae TaxID=126728 RepID=A0ABV2AQJ9_9EUKA
MIFLRIMAILNIACTLRIPNISRDFAYKKASENFGVARELWLLKGFKQVEDADQNFEFSLLLKCNQFDKIIKINANGNELLVDYLVFTHKIGKLESPYGDDIDMSCVGSNKIKKCISILNKSDLEEWKSSNPFHCKLPNRYESPFYKADFSRFVKNNHTAFSGCQTVDASLIETMHCRNGTINYKNCQDSKKHKYCGLDKLSPALNPNKLKWSIPTNVFMGVECEAKAKFYGVVTCKDNGEFRYSKNVPITCEVCNEMYIARMKRGSWIQTNDSHLSAYAPYSCPDNCESNSKGVIGCGERGWILKNGCNCYCRGIGKAIPGIQKKSKERRTNEGELLSLSCVDGSEVVGYYKCYDSEFIGDPYCNSTCNEEPQVENKMATNCTGKSVGQVCEMECIDKNFEFQGTFPVCTRSNNWFVENSHCVGKKVVTELWSINEFKGLYLSLSVGGLALVSGAAFASAYFL